KCRDGCRIRSVCRARLAKVRFEGQKHLVESGGPCRWALGWQTGTSLPMSRHSAGGWRMGQPRAEERFSPGILRCTPGQAGGMVDHGESITKLQRAPAGGTR